MRILVTGASGLLGLNMALEASQKHEVFGSVNKHEIRTTAFTVSQSDLTRPDAVKRLIDESRPDWVINCAALANLEACEANPVLAQQLNIELPENLAGFVARGGARLVYISTDAVFDGKKGDYSEEDKPNPLSVYARTKLAGEQTVMATNPRAIVARVNLFGWSLTGKRSLAEWFINNLSEGNPLMGFTDVYFCPLLANDLAQLIFNMLEKGLQGLYHVFSSYCTSKYEFGVRLAKRFDLDPTLIKPTPVSQAGLVAPRSQNLSMKSDKLTRDLGEAPPDLDSGLGRFYNQYLDGYPQFIRNLGA